MLGLGLVVRVCGRVPSDATKKILVTLPLVASFLPLFLNLWLESGQTQRKLSFYIYSTFVTWIVCGGIKWCTQS